MISHPGGDLLLQAQPRHPDACQEGCIVLPGFHLPDPRLHVAPDGANDEVGPQGEELRLAARAAGPDDGAARQRGEPRPVPRDQDLAHLFTAEHGADAQLVGILHGEVFQGMHGDVDA